MSSDAAGRGEGVPTKRQKTEIQGVIEGAGAKHVDTIGAGADEPSNSAQQKIGLVISPPGPSNAEEDCDSEGLEALEDAAEEEDPEEDEVDLLVAKAALIYPASTVESLVGELKQRGLVYFWRTHVVDLEPQRIQALLVALGVLLPSSVRNADDVPRGLLLSILRATLSRILRRREKLPQYNTVDDALQLIREAKNIVVLSGAGISVSCGIPDFRSKDGIYARLMSEGKYALTDPQDMFDKQYFLQDPACFYSFAHSIYPDNYTPSRAHRFIRQLELEGKLLRNYSQNIDTLEKAAGITRVLNAHGSFASATCTTCALRVDGERIRDDILARRVALCPKCHAPPPDHVSDAKGAGKKPKAPKRGRDEWQDDEEEEEDDAGDALSFGVMKPDITFFGEKLSDDFDAALLSDRERVDLLLILGTSLKVAPVSELPGHLPHSTPVVLVNRTPMLHVACDVQLLGDADVVVAYLASRLGWQLDRGGAQGESLEAMREPTRVADTHFWLFEGAEPGPYLEKLMRGEMDDDDDDDDDDDRDDDNGKEGGREDDDEGDDAEEERAEEGQVGGRGAGVGHSDG